MSKSQAPEMIVNNTNANQEQDKRSVICISLIVKREFTYKIRQKIFKRKKIPFKKNKNNSGNDNKTI